MPWGIHFSLGDLGLTGIYSKSWGYLGPAVPNVSSIVHKHLQFPSFPGSLRCWFTLKHFSSVPKPYYYIHCCVNIAKMVCNWVRRRMKNSAKKSKLQCISNNLLFVTLLITFFKLSHCLRWVFWSLFYPSSHPVSLFALVWFHGLYSLSLTSVFGMLSTLLPKAGPNVGFKCGCSVASPYHWFTNGCFSHLLHNTLPDLFSPWLFSCFLVDACSVHSLNRK